MTTINIQEILKILPHRYPMLMVDRIIECDDVKHIVGIKNLTFNEPFFQGHFSGMPVMPGVLQLEAMAQVGGVLLSRILKKQSHLPLFMAIDKAKFRNVLAPGDQMRIVVELLKHRGLICRLHGQVFSEDKLASEADMLFMFTDQKVQP